MALKPVKYTLVDAFTESAFKGNPAAVCFLDEEREQKWLQSVAAEFNISQTAFLTHIHNNNNNNNGSHSIIPRFGLRWFTPLTEVKLCGHATLAAAHTLFSSGLVDGNNNVIEFVTLSGILTVKRIPTINEQEQEETNDNGFYVELDFPADPIKDSNYFDETFKISEALNGAEIIDLKGTQNADDLFVVVKSGEAVIEVEPKLDEIVKFPGRGLIVTAAAPSGSGFDFYSRFFCPKFGINEDPACGTAHCALASYWSKKLGKCGLKAYQASRRGGVLNIQIDEKNQRVLLRGKAIIVMEGCILV
ncbi:hypothetical protein PIB30_012435 [Stylosanthes scabra]|uniref:Uncharacterized protein n=1 Tax=Stylosanthes scabra TaxID=79078 RepID=A0ABU6S6J9_9FABA|nr:hypothetical protein [Stylosanthes scabra]